MIFIVSRLCYQCWSFPKLELWLLYFYFQCKTVSSILVFPIPKSSLFRPCMPPIMKIFIFNFFRNTLSTFTPRKGSRSRSWTPAFRSTASLSSFPDPEPKSEPRPTDPESPEGSPSKTECWLTTKYALLVIIFSIIYH